MKKIALFPLVLVYCVWSVSLLSAQTITTSQNGTHDGFFYMFWTDGGGGSVAMTLGAGGNYSVTWSECSNFVCGKGWNPGSPDNVVSFSGSFNGGLNGYLSVYGWTKEPVIEYYIVENYGSWTPPGGTLLGMVASDGGIYNIYKVRRTIQGITGPGYFDQFWSVRTSKRSSGTVTVRKHVDAWQNLGLNLGTTWVYQFVSTEGYQSTGYSDITVGTLGPTPVPTPTTAITMGDVNGDGAISIVDALMIAQYAVGLTPANFQAAAADVNCDGNITILDALIVAQYFVRLLTSFPC